MMRATKYRVRQYLDVSDLDRPEMRTLYGVQGRSGQGWGLVELRDGARLMYERAEDAHKAMLALAAAERRKRRAEQSP